MSTSINRSSSMIRAAIFAVASVSAAAGAAWGWPCCPPSECEEGKQFELRGENGAEGTWLLGRAGVEEWLNRNANGGAWVPKIKNAWSGGKAEMEAALQAAQQAFAQASDQAHSFAWRRADGGGAGEHVWVVDPQGQNFWVQGAPKGASGQWIGAFAGGPGDDDKVKVKVFGKAVIVGPDGKTREFKFGEGSEGGDDDGDAQVIIKRIGPDEDHSQQLHEHLKRKIEGSMRGLRGLQGLHGLEGLHGTNHGDDGHRLMIERGLLGATAGGAQGQTWIGVQIAEPDEKVVEGFRIAPGDATRIEKVIEDSPAARAGVRDGDVVIRIDGRESAGVQQLQEAVRGARPGSELRVEVIREGQRLPLEVRPERRVGVRIEAQNEGDGDLSAADAQQRIEQIEERMKHIEQMLERLSEKLGNSPDGQRRAPARRAAPRGMGDGATPWMLRSGTPS